MDIYTRIAVIEGLPVWRGGAGWESLGCELGGGVVAYHLAGLVLLGD